MEHRAGFVVRWLNSGGELCSRDFLAEQLAEAIALEHRLVKTGCQSVSLAVVLFQSPGTPDSATSLLGGKL